MPSNELAETFERLGFVVRLTFIQKFLERDSTSAEANLPRRMCNSCLLKRRTSYLTLGAHAQRGLRYLVCVCVCVCLCVCPRLFAIYAQLTGK